MGLCGSTHVIDSSNTCAELCDKCKKQESITCGSCTQPTCAACCPHVHNPLYDAKPVILKNTKLNTGENKELTSVTTKCGIYSQNDKLYVFGESIYADKSCEWRLYNINDTGSTPGHVTKRFPDDERSVKFPGDVCSSEILGGTYFTLPCTRTVYSCNDHTIYRAMFTTEGSCFGIACFNGGFAVSLEIKTNIGLSSEWQIKVFNTKGHLQKQIYYDNSGNPLFKSPFFLASNKTETVLFVSDHERKAIIALDTDGQTLYEFVNVILNNPRGIAVDGEENVYVACGSRVVQVEKNATNHRELLPIKRSDKAVGVCFKTGNNLLTVMLESGAVTTIRMV